MRECISQLTDFKTYSQTIQEEKEQDSCKSIKDAEIDVAKLKLNRAPSTSQAKTVQQNNFSKPHLSDQIIRLSSNDTIGPIK